MGLFGLSTLIACASVVAGFAKLQSEEGFIDANMDLFIGDPAKLDGELRASSRPGWSSGYVLSSWLDCHYYR